MSILVTRVHALLALALVSPLGCGVGSDDCPATDPRGVLSLEALEGTGYAGVRVVSTFQRSPDPRSAIACRSQTVGPCVVTRCEGIGIDFVDEPRCGSGATLGTISVARRGEPAIVTQANTQVTLARSLAPGEALRVATTGADVPAFAVDVPVPARATVTGPEALVRREGLRVRAGEGLAITWTPVASRVRVTVGRSTPGASLAECVFDGTTGRGEVPAAAIADPDGAVTLATMEEVAPSAGIYRAAVRVLLPATAPAALYSRVE